MKCRQGEKRATQNAICRAVPAFYSLAMFAKPKVVRVARNLIPVGPAVINVRGPHMQRHLLSLPAHGADRSHRECARAYRLLTRCPLDLHRRMRNTEALKQHLANRGE